MMTALDPEMARELDDLRERGSQIIGPGPVTGDGVEQSELEEPRRAVEEAGATIELLSIEDGEIQAMRGDINPADTFAVDRAVSAASADDYDGLILPGGGQPRQASHPGAGPRLRPRHVRRGQASGGHLPRPVDARRVAEGRHAVRVEQPSTA